MMHISDLCKKCIVLFENMKNFRKKTYQPKSLGKFVVDIFSILFFSGNYGKPSGDRCI